MPPDKPLKLVLISRRYPPQIGGAERVMANMAAALAELGHHVTILSSQNTAEGVGKTPDTEPADDFVNPKLIRLPYNGLRVIGTAGYMRALWRWLVRHKPDLVYVSMLKHDAFVAVRAGKKAGFPVVLRPEGAGDTGDLAWQSRGRFGGRIGRATRQADAFVALSQRIADELLKAGYPAERIKTIANGVPVSEHVIPKDVTNSNVIFVGRLAHEKGLDTLLNAWPTIVHHLPDARLRLVGDGPLRDALEQQAQRLGIASSVEFCGSRTDVAQLLGQSSLFVLPSREEGLSIALLEAMALAVPVVVSDIPGNRILITPGHTGLVFKPGQASELSEAIKRSLLNRDEAHMMARAGHRLVLEQFSIQAVARQHVDLFRRLIDEKQI